jgi:hypothetical protein
MRIAIGISLVLLGAVAVYHSTSTLIGRGFKPETVLAMQAGTAIGSMMVTAGIGIAVVGYLRKTASNT